jgi:hypothetical protein
MKIKVVKKGKSFKALSAEVNAELVRGTPNPMANDINPAAQLIGACFEARNLAHKFHLQTRSYAKHMALASFYEGIIPLTDAYAEAWQGRNGIIEVYPQLNVSCNDPIDLVADLRGLIDNIR